MKLFTVESFLRISTPPVIYSAVTYYRASKTNVTDSVQFLNSVEKWKLFLKK